MTAIGLDTDLEREAETTASGSYAVQNCRLACIASGIRQRDLKISWWTTPNRPWGTRGRWM